MEAPAQKPMPSGDVFISMAARSDNDALDRYVLRNVRASHYHLSGWRDLVERTFGHRIYCLYARDDAGEVCGLLPLVRLTSRIFGDFIVSMPFVNYGGAVGNDSRTESRLMEEAAVLGGHLGVSHVEFRDTHPREGYQNTRTDKVAMVLSLPGNTEDLWRSVGAKLRAQVRRPKREGAEVVQGGAELVGDFYRVFARNMRDLGTPVYGRGFFAAVLDQFSESATIKVVRMKGRAVAAALLLGHGGRVEVPWASSLREYNALGVNMLLYWSLLEHAIQAGSVEFDFGRSTKGSGTWRFKKQWGAREAPLYWHYWLAPGRSLPGLRTDNPKFALAIRLWQRLPLRMANFLGPSIVKNLP